MKTVYFTDKISEATKKSAPCALVLGGFDGLHAGHRTLLEKAKSFALPVGVMTIDGGKEGLPLFNLAERERMFLESGADFCFPLRFDEIKSLSPQAFCELLLENFSPKAFVCGEDFAFGAAASGNADALRAVTSLPVYQEPLVFANGVKVSSSAVKEALKTGDMSKANALLEKEFFLLGKVVRDRGVGKTIGFPTANILYPSDKFPLPHGVYETQTEIDGKSYRGITNYGARPTFGEAAVTTETYLDGFSGELYGKELKISFRRFLRKIVRFQTVDELKEQLNCDLGRVRNHD